MLTTDVIAHFGHQAAIANALEISRAAVSKWGSVVPEGSAYKLQAITHGKLKVRPELYRKHHDKTAEVRV